MAETQSNISRDQKLRQRAQRVIPGGMWGHQRAAAVPAGFPQFFDSGQGATVRDVDGNEYIDFMCAWGPIILGHQHPVVEAAAQAQAALGLCLDGPTEHVVDLAELVVEMIDHAQWALFQKNGSDAMTGCVTIARAGTGRRKVLVAHGAYHGAVPWCSPSLVGVTAEDRAHILHFDWNDTDSLETAIAQAGADLAAIVVSAFRHDLGVAMEMPTPAFAQAARAACDAAGAALIIDDVRAGFRLDLGGSWNLVGVQPDLSAWSKAIANGHPLAMITGNERFREAARNVFVTGSFWYSGAPMAAAAATLRELRRIDGPAVMARAGRRLRDGLAEQAARHGFALIQSGPPAMPLVQFAGDDAQATLGERFCIEALRRGVYMHHRHNMFLSCAHTEAVIDAALVATEGAFAALAAEGAANA
ncbi:aminotransferase class III-fold pyridoxal phosphate-dependent enzyme [Pukyongiella litopenaei]|uniref:aminotransferase class III-fold pyridoxal phosphate-dependent enzyme n=1 Tax=Pukyongiella litopenaei TaxID=2605946 RepID=UPI001B8007FD|nr:aminotransferase class III-fold pyridoxal phosphate-dependent enzyme [Pukyongiella litopenaei]